MNKEYIAIVNGIPEVQCREIMIPIGKAVDSTITYKYQADPDGKDAVTLIEECKPIGKKYALLRMRPLTGRTHQIRVHCAAIGHPIVGDKLYSMEESAYRQWRQNPQEFTGVLDFYVMRFIVSQLVFCIPIQIVTVPSRLLYMKI